VIKTDVSTETLPVAMEKSTDVLPAGTVTLAGTLATDALLLVSLTCAPPAGAAAFNVTVAVAELPAVTLEGFTVILLTDVAVVVEPSPPVPVPAVLEAGVPENPPLLLWDNAPQPTSVESTRITLTVGPITCSRKPVLNRVLTLAKSTMASPNRRTTASTPSPH
jgi:hypothetical protein